MAQKYPGGRLTASWQNWLRKEEDSVVPGAPDVGNLWQCCPRSRGRLVGQAGNTGSHRAREKGAHQHHPGAWSSAWHIVAAQKVLDE